ncbi:MAG: hypothetical protein A3D41_00155, partial [Candidatus Sungbacteria bacterium RIFCSPHIGHO2_02_FULL_41_12b]
MKILFAIGRLTVGGGEKLLVYQLKHLDRNKFEPYLLTLFPEKEESFERELRQGLLRETRSLGAWWKQLNFRGLFDFISWFKLYKFLKKEKFDVAVTSLFSANLFVRLALLFSGKPKVLISYEHNIYRDKHRWQIWLDWFLAKFTDKIIVDAESVKKFTANQEGIPVDKFLVMHIPPLANAVKIWSFAEDQILNAAGDLVLNADVKVRPPAGGRTLEDIRRELRIKPDDKVILTVSRLVEEKGHIYLIRAAKEVIKNFPNVKFLIVGWGHLEQSLKDEVKKLELENNVKLLGKRDIAEVLPLAALYIEPALSVDIGIASMEAMAQGLPIISTNVGEMPVFVKDGENGFLVPPADSSAMSEKILTLLKDSELRKKMGVASREKVKDFTIEKYMQK